ncbi:hypothetical protein BCR37DRAFT_380962 [Protomyces lactucae-debilis]|uniref:Uncharacterized protein n=1 Tax=Protomyces lactucae-debilis TaxID=2754530 RepID=A0A1Y2FAX3_PROLT|nr:uncharacterized protein BCR37DRAFT_380962 [Protomyces lactucae-debilis]ORY81041.1 hypothetical protein BCR37DRAFT_380962 [Protomyces lactucae-debilis]
MLESFCGAAGKSSPVHSEISNAAVAKARGQRHGSTIDLPQEARRSVDRRKSYDPRGDIESGEVLCAGAMVYGALTLYPNA